MKSTPTSSLKSLKNEPIKTPKSNDTKTPKGKPEQMFASKKSAASYLTNDVPFLAQVKSTKRVVETTDDNEEVKMPASDTVQRRAERKAIRIDDNPQKGATTQITENVKKIEKTKTSQDIQFIINCLKQHFVFYNLSMKEL